MLPEAWPLGEHSRWLRNLCDSQAGFRMMQQCLAKLFNRLVAVVWLAVERFLNNAIKRRGYGRIQFTERANGPVQMLAHNRKRIIAGVWGLAGEQFVANSGQ